MRHRLQSRQLFIADLVRRQHEMESGQVPMQPMAYRVLAKRLRQVLDAVPWSTDLTRYAELPAYLLPQVADLLESRHFDQYGYLMGSQAQRCADEAAALLARVRSLRLGRRRSPG